MAWYLTAPSHHMNQCWQVMSQVLWHLPENNGHRKRWKYLSLICLWKLVIKDYIRFSLCQWVNIIHTGYTNIVMRAYSLRCAICFTILWNYPRRFFGTCLISGSPHSLNHDVSTDAYWVATPLVLFINCWRAEFSRANVSKCIINLWK